MLRTVILAAAVFCFATTSGHSTEITLKSSLMRGLHYSVDGGRFHPVGAGGFSIYRSMTGNEPAQKEVLHYRGYKRWSNLFAITGVTIVGYTILEQTIRNDWKKSNTVLAVATIPLTLLSISYNSKATRHLKEAVRIFNSEEQTLDLDIGMRQSLASGAPQTSLGLSLRF